MKILYYSPHPDLSLHSASGYGTHMREMIRAFEQHGHQVDTLVMGDYHTNTSRHQSSDRPGFLRQLKEYLPTFAWESIKDGWLRNTDRRYETILTETIESVQPDLIYERAAYLQVSGVRVAQRFGLPHCLEMNSPYIVENRVLRGTDTALKFLAKRAEREQLHGTSKTAVVSAALVDYFVEHHGVTRDAFVCTPNGIDPLRVTSSSSRVDALRSQLNINGKTVIGFVGSLTIWQRVDLLIEAYHLLADRHPDTCVLIVGDSHLRGELNDHVHALGLNGRITFTGRVPHDDVYNYIDLMDIAVLPDNLWYGSPTKLFEYGAMGKAVVAPANRTISQLIDNGREGMLVDPTPHSIAHAIEHLLLDEQMRLRLAATFQEKVINSYTWAHNVERVLEAIGAQPVSA